MPLALPKTWSILGAQQWHVVSVANRLKFCGRGMCKEHHDANLPHIMAMFRGGHEASKAVAVSGARWCGECRPQPEPIEMPEFY